VMRSLEAPIRQIAENSGKEGSVVTDYVRSHKEVGFNADKNTYEDLVKAGIVDPTKVVRSALQNAASIGALLLTTEVLVAEKPEEKKEPPMPAGGGGYGGGMY
ncbi:MAG TPA: TCP-1/cpn60 chaperonin family protein, partial [bacterium]|nr:TCP-1/cpn60 chaperonin family protein [bacterium]